MTPTHPSAIDDLLTHSTTCHREERSDVAISTVIQNQTHSLIHRLPS